MQQLQADEFVSCLPSNTSTIQRQPGPDTAVALASAANCYPATAAGVAQQARQFKCVVVLLLYRVLFVHASCVCSTSVVDVGLQTGTVVMQFALHCGAAWLLQGTLACMTHQQPAALVASVPTCYAGSATWLAAC